MLISATELKNNLGKYLELAGHEDIMVMKKNRSIAMLISPEKGRLLAWRSLAGSIPPISEEEQRQLKDERLGLS